LSHSYPEALLRAGMMKLGLTKQRDLLPAIAVIPQIMVPTGGSDFTANRVLPGLNVDMSWGIVKNFFGVEVLIANKEVAGKYTLKYMRRISRPILELPPCLKSPRSSRHSRNGMPYFK